MTRYVCAHPSHRRGDEAKTVDVTAQVRAERAMLPRPAAYLAYTEDVIDAVMGFGERAPVARVERLISGIGEPGDLPVVLMSRRSSARRPGRYELGDLRDEPAIAGIMDGVGPSHVGPGLAEDDVVVLEDESTSRPSAPRGSQAPTSVLTRPQERTRVMIPQGVFRLHELASSLAIAERTEPALIDAIRATPRTDTGTVLSTNPWRVVVTCPKAEGSPPTTHDLLFTGTGGPEPLVAYGTPVDSWDAGIEAASRLDMAPAAETARVERRVWLLLGAEVVVLAALLVFGWLSGALALASRESSAWLGLALILAVTAIAFSAVPLFAVRDPAVNMNDTLVLERLYESRVTMLRWAASISATLFGFALLFGVIPPLTLDRAPVPAATVTFETSSRPITATMRVHAKGVGTGDVLSVTMREYRNAIDPVGTLLGQVTRQGTPSGVVSVSETFAVDTSASYVSVLVSNGPASSAACSPTATGAPGCTVLAVPQFAPTRTTTVVVPSTVAPTPSPSATGSPSATSSPTP